MLFDKDRTMKTTLSRLVGALLLAPLMAVQAQVANGGFEADLSGWSTLGDARTQGGAPAGASQLWLTTASVAFEDDAPFGGPGARNRSGIAAAGVGAPGGVESFLGLQLGALDPDVANGVQAVEGSAARQAFTANAGDVLSFQWDFGTSDTFADYAFVVIDGTVTRLANPGDASEPGTLDNDFRTGVMSFSHTFAVGGTHSVGFGVVDVIDFNATSTLAVDAVQIAAVPEMPATALALIGLLAIARNRQRRSRT